jgi:hypothetical protein
MRGSLISLDLKNQILQRAGCELPKDSAVTISERLTRHFFRESGR